MSDEEYTAARAARYSRSRDGGLRISKSDPEWPQNSAEAIRDALNREKSPFATDADLRMLVDRLFTDESKLYNLGNLNTAAVARVAQEMFAQSQIGLCAPARAAYQDAQNQHSDYDFSPVAFQFRIFEKLRELDWDCLNTTDVADVMAWMIENEGVQLSTQGRQTKEAKELGNAIQVVKTRILGGKDKWPQWDPQHGQVMWRDASLLDSMSAEELNRTDDEVATLRRQTKMTSGELREELRSKAKAAGIPTPFRPGDKTSLDVETRYKDGGKVPGSVLEIVGDAPRPSADPRMDRSVPTVSADRSIFVSPHTNEYYTKKEICHIANHNPELFRRLSKTDARFLNQLLAQAN